MNLQAATRLLRGPRPRVRAALEAIADCLDAERDLTDMLDDALDRASSGRAWTAVTELPTFNDTTGEVRHAE